MHKYKLSDEQYLKELEMKDLRTTAFHEAGHKIIYHRFGGSGNAVIWKNPNGGGLEELYWLGHFQPHTCPQVLYEAHKRSGYSMGFKLPKNWRRLVGLAGVVSEEIMRGETDEPWIVAEDIDSRISAGQMSASDLEYMGITDLENYALNTADVEQVWRYLLEDWSSVEREAQYLIQDTSK